MLIEHSIPYPDTQDRRYKMPSTFLWLGAFLSLALMLGASLGHLFELPHKMQLSGAEYLTVQQIYQGWNRLGFAVFVALATSVALTISLRANRPAFAWSLSSLSALAGTQLVFWTWTFPVNTETQNWTILPDQWMRLRAQWEYSHAAGALLCPAALMALVLAVLASTQTRKTVTRASVPGSRHQNWSRGKLDRRRGQVLDITTGF